jgi:hypothetical protein
MILQLREGFPLQTQLERQLFNEFLTQDTSTKWFFASKRLRMARYGPERV